MEINVDEICGYLLRMGLSYEEVQEIRVVLEKHNAVGV